MKFPSTILSLLFIMASSTGCTSSDNTTDPDNDRWFGEVRWSNRILALSGTTPNTKEQIELLQEYSSGVLERDLLVVNTIDDDPELIIGQSDGLPQSQSFRERYDLPTETFCIVLVGKDGRVKERRFELFQPTEIFAIIDAMPMRMEEMRDRKSQ